jgi:hypothetical protein
MLMYMHLSPKYVRTHADFDRQRRWTATVAFGEGRPSLRPFSSLCLAVIAVAIPVSARLLVAVNARVEACIRGIGMDPAVFGGAAHATRAPALTARGSSTFKLLKLNVYARM